MKRLWVVFGLISVLMGFPFNESVVGAKDYKIYSKPKTISVKVSKVSRNKVKLKVINKGDNFFTSEMFVLKRFEDDRWKKLNFKDSAKFIKTIPIYKCETRSHTFNWKKFFGKKLSPGKYKMKWIGTKVFVVK